MESSAQKKNNLPLIYYRMPDDKEVCFIQSESAAVEIDSLLNVPEKPGFIFYPFAPDSACKPLFISGHSLVVSRQSSVKSDHCQLTTDHCHNTQYPIPNTKTKEEYCKNVADAIKAIRSGELQKVVLSRVKSIKASPNPSSGEHEENPLSIFYELCNHYPSAFVSFVYIPGKVMWVTASPELLISAENNKIETVSLAGTKPINSLEGWGEKEKTEQQLVTDYINEILQKYCRNIIISDAKELVAGNVKHLKTTFSATLNANFWNLVSALHPTPAVCGIPLNKAKQFIEQTEGYDRKYYTGFLGPCNIAGKTDLFVNLRCAELFADGINLYIGGGITKDSVPEAEWEETELKAKTLVGTSYMMSLI